MSSADAELASPSAAVATIPTTADPFPITRADYAPKHLLAVNSLLQPHVT